MASRLSLAGALTGDPGLRELAARIEAGRLAEAGGAPDGAWGLLAWALMRATGRSVLVVTADPQSLIDDLAAFDDAPRPLHYPAADVLPMDRSAPSPEIVAARLETQGRLLASAEPQLVFTAPQALVRPAPPPGLFREGVLDVAVGPGRAQADLVRWLVDWGYVREAQVEQPGEFAARGGIVDVYPPAGVGGLRIEYFGDDVESIRGFDPTSQASITRHQAVRLLPAREFPHRAADTEATLRRLEKLDLSKALPEVADDWRGLLASVREAGYAPGIEALYPYVVDAPASLLEYFQSPPVVLVTEPERQRQAAARQRRDTEELLASESEHGELPLGLSTGLLDYAEIERAWQHVVHLERVSSEGGVDLGWQPPPAVAGRLETLGSEVNEMLAAGQRVLLLSGHTRRVSELLADGKVVQVELDTLTLEEEDLPLPDRAAIVEATLHTGFGIPSAELSVFSDLELFGTARPPRRRKVRRTGPATDAAAAFKLDIEPGSLVVHRDHGVGIFKGLRSLDDGGAEREYINLEYHGGDKVFVPVEHMDRIQLYMGGTGDDEGPPRLSRLGTGEWDRTKQKVRRAVMEMAGELIAIYARREVAEGHAFSPDGAWQAELEAAFPYQETPDQLRALEEIKADMEEPRPMDRLLVGDVGFGKTEVALRAAFKAATDGKQVAILVPTTVLANQHFMTFTERLKPYPIRVGMLSRFVEEADAAAVAAGLADGAVDIVIATHRILTSKVRFKDLGLVVIDEEQRFGVAQKERLKRLRASVDVLSMSATPIPRTLHMSLGGIRDLSVLATPPEERQPVRTFVTADADNLIREVVLRELHRGSQAFFVHNRVRTINRAADRIKRLVPEARVITAHGQMEEHELARVMASFITRDFDVLVSTTIIESGIDIPTANAIMVQDADRFGLADLYQLRGRVGRSGARAYAYFLFNPERSLTEHADKRLDVIGEYQELGSGFKLALKDLEIRGAGNLLGREQSGEISAVGLEMYNQMLRDAVNLLHEGGPDAAVHEVAEVRAVNPLELPIDHFLPHDYVPDETVRLQVYQQLAAAPNEAQLNTQARRLRDRFGPLPGAVENLVYSLRVKLAAQAAGVAAIQADATTLEIRLVDGEAVDLGRLADRHRDVSASRTRLRFQWAAAGDSWRERLLALLEELRQARAELVPVAG
ncbi:MAG: transcription-repair coupling factor [Candidatus Dormibacteria bacterium]